MPAVNSMKAEFLMPMSARERWRILAEATLIVMMVEFERIDRWGISQRSNRSVSLWL
jgi:hypothetical protein